MPSRGPRSRHESSTGQPTAASPSRHQDTRVSLEKYARALFARPSRYRRVEILLGGDDQQAATTPMATARAMTKAVTRAVTKAVTRAVTTVRAMTMTISWQW